MTPESRGIMAFAVVASAALALGGFVRPGPGAAIAIVVAALSGFAMTGLLWQVAMLLAVLVLVALAKVKPDLGSIRPSRGRVPVLETVFCAAVTPVALGLWLRLAHPDVSDLVRAVPNLPLPLLAAGGAAFALINAALEEVIWRGVFQSRLAELFGSPWAIAIQAASFGITHAHGFPRGLVGVVLAGVWGGMLGLLRQRAGGLLAPVLAHIVADATIATILIALAH